MADCGDRSDAEDVKLKRSAVAQKDSENVKGRRDIIPENAKITLDNKSSSFSVESVSDQRFRNLPGRFDPHAHVNLMNTQMETEHQNMDMLPPLPRPGTPSKLPLIQMPIENKMDLCISPDPGKRRRIQHDYRRLSSSGYVDDYTGRERFSSTSESELSPTPPKVKPIKIKIQQNMLDDSLSGFHAGNVRHWYF